MKEIDRGSAANIPCGKYILQYYSAVRKMFGCDTSPYKLNLRSTVPLGTFGTRAPLTGKLCHFT